LLLTEYNKLGNKLLNILPHNNNLLPVSKLLVNYIDLLAPKILGSQFNLTDIYSYAFNNKYLEIGGQHEASIFKTANKKYFETMHKQHELNYIFNFTKLIKIYKRTQLKLRSHPKKV
jgi:hypothetical protein